MPTSNDMATMFGQRPGWIMLQGPCGGPVTDFWKAGTCLKCGAKVLRQRRDVKDVDWEADFLQGVEEHEQLECMKQPPTFLG